MRLILKKDKVIDGSVYPIGSELTVSDDAAQQMIDANEAIQYSTPPEFEDETFSRLLDEVLPQARKKKAEK